MRGSVWASVRRMKVSVDATVVWWFVSLLAGCQFSSDVSKAADVVV